MKRIALVAIAAIVFALSASAGRNDRKGAFAWGAEIGPAIDLCGDDMSSINFGASFGYRNSFIDFAGVGAEINMMMSNSTRMFPVFAAFKSSFSNEHKLIFADFRVGCAFANAFGEKSQTVFYTSPGIGFNLAGNDKFQSYLTLRYIYSSMNFPALKASNEVTGTNQIAISIGITF